LLSLASFIKLGDSAITKAAYQGHFDITELLLKSKVFVLFFAFILILKVTLPVIQLILLVTVRLSRDLPMLR
jgi:hypothetical protein